MSLFGTLNWLYRWWDPARGSSPRVLATQITNQFLHGLSSAPQPEAAIPDPREA
jgi:hypothetical protein